VRVRLHDASCQRHSERLHLLTAAVLFALSSALTWQLSALLSALAAVFVLFLAFVGPLWFMHVQETKKYVASAVFLPRRGVMRIPALTHAFCLCPLPAARFSAPGTSPTSSPSSSERRQRRKGSSRPTQRASLRGRQLRGASGAGIAIDACR
jgi:hypothetical protein